MLEILFPSSLRLWFREQKQRWRRMRFLWKRVPDDCKVLLVQELILRPRDLDRRYAREVQFARKLESHWQ